MANGNSWDFSLSQTKVKELPDISPELREQLLTSQHGIPEEVIGLADEYWGTGDLLRYNPELAADAIDQGRKRSSWTVDQEARDAAAKIPLGQRGDHFLDNFDQEAFLEQFAWPESRLGGGRNLGGQIRKVVPTIVAGVSDGVKRSLIDLANFQEMSGTLSAEAGLARRQILRSRMSDPDNLNDDGLALETIGTAAEIGGGMLPAFAAGVKRALGISPAVGIAADKLVAPKKLGAPKVGKAAAAAAVVGFGSGFLERSTKEQMGSIYGYLRDSTLEIYRHRETGEILSYSEYHRLKRTNPAYTRAGGYEDYIETIPMPLNIAKSVAMAGGAISGLLELMQVGLAGTKIAPEWIKKIFPTKKVAQLFAKKTINRMIEDGSLLRFARAKAGEGIVLGSQETGVEVLQDMVFTLSTRVAGDLAEEATDANVPRDQREALGAALVNGLVATVTEAGPAVMLLSVTGVGGAGAVQYAGGRHRAKVADTKALNQADGSTAAYFNQPYGEDVPVGEINLPDEISDTDRVKAKTILNEVRNNTTPTKLDPLDVHVRDDGSLFVEDPLSAAIVAVANDAGLKTVRIARIDSARGPKNGVPPSEEYSDSVVAAQIANQFPDLSVEEVRARMEILQLAAIHENTDVDTWVTEHFQDGQLFQTEGLTTLDEAISESGVIPGRETPTTEDAVVTEEQGTAPLLGERQSKAIGRTLDMLRFNWQAGEWKTVSEWLEASGLENVVDAEELSLKLNADGSVPVDAYAFALRSYLEEGPSLPKEVAPAGVAAATGETAVPDPDIDEMSDEAFAAIQTQKMRAVDGLRESIGSTMSSKTYLAGVEADAASAADEFQEQAAKNVAADLYDVTEGADRTVAEHAVLIDPLIEEERMRLISEDDAVIASNNATLMKQAEEERREAAMEADLEPGEAAVPEIAGVEDPQIADPDIIVSEEGEVARVDLIQAFDTRISTRVLPVIYQDAEHRYYILSGLAKYNAALSARHQFVKGTILRADAGVTIEQAKAFATERARRFPDVPESTPVARTEKTERVVIKSKGEEVGAVRFDAMGSAMFEAFKSSDFKSWVHGLASVFRRLLPARDEAIAASWAGVTSFRKVEGRTEWNWTPSAEYKFAAGFEQYLREGRVRIPEMQPVWDRLSNWTKTSYVGNSARLSRRVRNVYEDLLVDKQSPALKAFRQNIEKVGQVSDMLFQSPASRFTLRLKADEGRDLREIGENEAESAEGGPRTRVEALDESGKVVLVRKYGGTDPLGSAVRDISGVPTLENPAPIGASTFAPFRAKRTVSGQFYGAGPEGDPTSALSELGTEGTIYVGGEAVNKDAFIEEVIDELEEAGPLKQSGLVNIPTVKSWRRYPYVAELMANGVEGQLFQLLSRDIDAGRAAEKGTRFETQNLIRQKMLSRGWTKADIINLTRDLDKPVEVKGWKHTRAKPTWTASELLSLNRHLRVGQNREVLLRDGFRDSPRKKPKASEAYGEIIKVDADDIRAINKAVSELPEHYREFGTVIIDEVMDTLHERMDPVHRKSRGRSLGYVPYYWELERKTSDVKDKAERAAIEEADDALDYWRGRGERPGQRLGLFTGMTKHRTKVSAPLILRPLEFQLMRNIDRSSMYVGFELPMKALRELFSDTRALDAMDRRMDRASREGIEKSLSDVARRWSDGGEIDRLVKHIIRKVSVAQLGGSPGVWAKQALSIPLYNVYVPSQYLLAATARGVPGSGQFKDMEERLSAYDPVFVARRGGFDISLQGALENSQAGQVWARQPWGDFFMKGISTVDKRAVVIGSEAAVMQAMNEFRTGQISTDVKAATGIRTRAQAMELGPDGMIVEAYKYANYVTTRTQPNFLPEHVSNFQRDRVGRVFSQFSGFTNMAYNLLARTRWRHKYDSTPESASQLRKAWAGVLVFNTAGIIFIDFLWAVAMGRAPEPEELPSWAARKAITSATGLLYGIRDAVWWAANPGYGPMSLPAYEFFSEPVAAVYGVVDDLIKDGEISERAMSKSAQAFGLLSGVPAGAYYRIGKRAYDVVDPLL